MRIQILSLLANEYSYAEVSKFNPPNYKDTSSVKREEREEEDLEVEDRTADQVVEEHLYFLYPVSRYIYRKARAHYHQHKHALAPMPKSKITRWHWDLETVVKNSSSLSVNLEAHYCLTGKHC